MAEATARLLAWIEDSYPQAKTAMRSPAPQEAISAISRETHCDLPLSLETLWLAYDGEDAKKGAKLFNGYALMSTGEALEKVTSMCEVRETSTTDRWLPQWLPFAQDKGGDLLGLAGSSKRTFDGNAGQRSRMAGRIGSGSTYSRPSRTVAFSRSAGWARITSPIPGWSAA